MKNAVVRTLALLGFALMWQLAITAGQSARANSRAGTDDERSASSEWTFTPGLDNPRSKNGLGHLATSAAATTVVLASYKFDSGGSCTAQGWTTVDLTVQTGDYWHIDDMAGLPWGPLANTKSAWVGARVPPGPDVNLCSYAGLPGYGNGWNQAFCSVDCLPVSGGNTTSLDLSYTIKFICEEGYDALALEYTNDCSGATGWMELDGGKDEWSGSNTVNVGGAYPATGNVKIRFRFTSDLSWSNQDGIYNGMGAQLDDITFETIPLEDFEGEAVGSHGANSDGDPALEWTSCNPPGFGNYLALFKKAGANYEDPLNDNLSCYWAAILNSTEFYSCGSPAQPTQAIVPHVNVRGQYIRNEIWSPAIGFGASTGSVFRLRYLVYRDLPLANLVFHVWHVRTIDGIGCPSRWKDFNAVYYGAQKDWHYVQFSVGSLLKLQGAVACQLAIGVIDMCPFWCGSVYPNSTSGQCHSPAPYIDQVKLTRVDTKGAQWSLLNFHSAQSTFPTNGTIAGAATFAMASNTSFFKAPKPPTARVALTTGDPPTSGSSLIVPGDSLVVLELCDPEAAGTGLDTSGLLNDPNISTFVGRDKTKKQCYLYAAVWPLGQPGKSGAPLSEGPGGQANRYPFSGTIVAGGVTWTKIRMDYTYVGDVATPGLGTGTQPLLENRFNVDLNDNLFTAGDTVCYFYGASSPNGDTYYSSEWGATDNISEVAANPMTFTVLPAGGYNRGGNILYVDGADGEGGQPYFDGALQVLGLLDKVDRYDVRDPMAGGENTLASRVSDVVQQLNGAYQIIIWDCGTSDFTLGDGTGDPQLADDYGLLNTFLGNLTGPGGVYLCGDRVAEHLYDSAGASAVNFRSSYMPFTLISRNHRLAPTLFSVSPKVIHWPGRGFSDDAFVYGGGPEMNDFDVLGASGPSRVEMSYNTASNANGAVVSNVNGNASVVLSGFSLAFLRDDELNGISDRAQHLHDILALLGGSPNPPTAAGPALTNELRQNYPNPFNPQTTIAFSIKARGTVELSVYDVGGRLVRTLANETHAAGAYQLTWDGRDQSGSAVASGVYFYKLTAGDFSQTKKMVLLK